MCSTRRLLAMVPVWLSYQPTKACNTENFRMSVSKQKGTGETNLHKTHWEATVMGANTQAGKARQGTCWLGLPDQRMAAKQRPSSCISSFACAYSDRLRGRRSGRGGDLASMAIS